MKRILIDSEDNIIYEGPDSKEVQKILLAHPSDVTESDEIKYESLLRSLQWRGELRYEIHFNLKFRGIDYWNRPVFKDEDSTLYFGSVEKLYGYEEFNKEGLQFFKDHPEYLEYFGDHFGCEPHGGRSKYWKFNFI